jgi:G protein-coupled receptor Mth (Methuselah protein)
MVHLKLLDISEWEVYTKFTLLSRFRMCFWLFCVMGINWVMEVVSWFAGGPDYIWYVTDVINTLQGLIIFLIFVLEPRVRSCVWKQWGHKLSQILCRSQPRHASVIYHTPEEAAVRINT